MLQIEISSECSGVSTLFLGRDVTVPAVIHRSRTTSSSTYAQEGLQLVLCSTFKNCVEYDQYVSIVLFRFSFSKHDLGLLSRHDVQLSIFLSTDRFLIDFTRSLIFIIRSKFS
jgi:hypothetical protein